VSGPAFVCRRNAGRGTWSAVTEDEEESVIIEALDMLSWRVGVVLPLLVFRVFLPFQMVVCALCPLRRDSEIRRFKDPCASASLKDPTGRNVILESAVVTPVQSGRSCMLVEVAIISWSTKRQGAGCLRSGKGVGAYVPEQ